ncbi:MAG TPA: BTAD domain-containing putative transcriptional regulator [Gemmatimonadaceae bacterium]|nr:BTAD domain-containing putative transcriptional regulator [Gemmatimonadaceae bacterium]
MRLLGGVELARVDGRNDAEAESLLRGLARQPKRLALLSYLALAPEGMPRRRDTLLALFWPELDDARARAALRQLIHHLRRALGTNSVVSFGDDELALADDVWCDVRAFQEHARAGRAAEALELYRGELLQGFFASGVAAEFEQWLDEERARLRTLAADAAWNVAESRRIAHDATGALHWGRRALTVSPDDETAVRRFIVLCDRVGDRAAALRAYDEFTARLARDFEVAPSAETQALMSTVRERNAVYPSGEWLAEVRPSRDTSAAPPSPQPEIVENDRVRPLSRARLALPAAAVLLLAGAAWGSWRLRAHDDGPVVVVGAVTDYDGDSASIVRPLRDMLATNLARVPGLHVVSSARVYELAAGLRHDDGVGRPAAEPERMVLTRAARAARADEAIDGSLYRRSDGTLRLDLRRIDLATGALRGAYEVSGVDVFALVDRATAELASGLARAAPESLHVADASTRSLVAYRFYQEGLRAYYQNDLVSSLRLFSGAVDEDSSFAMAEYYLAQTQHSLGLPMLRTLTRALHAAEPLPDRDRLLVKGLWAAETNDPTLLPVAETLAVRYPSEPDAMYLHGLALAAAGDFNGSARAMLRVVSLDSGMTSVSDERAVPRGDPARCRSCEALQTAVFEYIQADSIPAAARLARQWLRWQPRSASAWLTFGMMAGLQAKTDSALAAYRQSASLSHTRDVQLGFLVTAYLQAARFAECDSLLAEATHVSDPRTRAEALWYLAIDYRTQGRLKEAWSVGRELQSLADAGKDSVVDGAAYTARITRAQLLLERGLPRASAVLFDSLVPPWRPGADSAPGRTARARAWQLAHAISAYAAAHDTSAIVRRLPLVDEAGRASSYGRDDLLIHYARGLLFTARGQLDSSASELRRALYSPTNGYTRAHYELGRILLALHRPREAATVLAPALRGAVEASAYYLSITELHDLLARAYEEGGQRDSAAAHYRWVARAWSRGDVPFRVRAEAAGRRARELVAGASGF